MIDVTHTGTLIAPDDGTGTRAYFYIGREDEVISAVQTRNASTAISNVDPSCRHLVMVGFGRDGDAHSVGRYRPGMTILQVQTNRDLQLAWLKEDKTDTAFTIISEPEVRLHQLENGRVQLEVVGLNCFNPKLGVVEDRRRPADDGDHGRHRIRHGVVPGQADQRAAGRAGTKGR